MLISQKIETKWNPKTKKYYENLGYTYTKMGDPLIVNVEDLKDYSRERVICQCDYCGREYSVEWGSYKHLKEKENNKDCCGDPKCTTQKSQESLMNKYGVQSAFSLESTREKTKQTNLKRHGYDNPFNSDEVKSRIHQTMIKKYGTGQTLKERADNQSIGNENTSAYTELYTAKKRSHSDGRYTPEYDIWRKSVFKRDNYTCQRCGQRGCTLNAHHILNWASNENLRTDVNNGITLCKECHELFHSIYGKYNNNQKQLDEFLNTTEKVC